MKNKHRPEGPILPDDRRRDRVVAFLYGMFVGAVLSGLATILGVIQ